MTQIPISCTLTAEDRSIRGDEWRRFLNSSIDDVRRSGHSARLLLKGGDDVLLTAIDLARREKDCCAFFEFRLQLLPDEAMRKELEADYQKMIDAGLLLGDAEPFDELMKRCEALQKRANRGR